MTKTPADVGQTGCCPRSNIFVPKTSDSGVRMYTEKDIEVLKVIYNLVKVRGFKIASARKMLHTNREGADKQKEVLDCLMRVRDDLKRLKAQLDGLV